MRDDTATIGERGADPLQSQSGSVTEETRGGVSISRHKEVKSATGSARGSTDGQISASIPSTRRMMPIVFSDISVTSGGVDGPIMQRESCSLQSVGGGQLVASRAAPDSQIICAFVVYCGEKCIDGRWPRA